MTVVRVVNRARGGATPVAPCGPCVRTILLVDINVLGLGWRARAVAAERGVRSERAGEGATGQARVCGPSGGVAPVRGAHGGRACKLAPASWHLLGTHNFSRVPGA